MLTHDGKSLLEDAIATVQLADVISAEQKHRSLALLAGLRRDLCKDGADCASCAILRRCGDTILEALCA